MSRIRVRFKVTVRGQPSDPVSAITLNLLEHLFSNFTKKLIIIRRYGTHNIYVIKLKVKVTNWGQRSKYVSASVQKSIKANFIRLHRKIKHHERICHAKTLVPTVKVTEINGQMVSSKLLKTTVASVNFMQKETE